MAAPAASTDIIWPDWTNSVDNWREQDAEWLRNRSIQIFPDGATRTSVLGTVPQFGVHSILQSGSPVGGPDFWNGSAWESVRYPNVSVVSTPAVNPTSITMKVIGSASGIQLNSDGSVGTLKNVVGVGGLGYTGDQNGLLLKTGNTGNKSVQLGTDANGLTIKDGGGGATQVSITGALTLTGNLTVPIVLASTSVGTSGSPVPNVYATAITGVSLTDTGAIQGGTVQGGTVILTGNQVKATAGNSAITLATDSTVTIGGATITLGGGVTSVLIPNTLGVTGLTTFGARPVVSAAGKDASIGVAMVIMNQGGGAPTSNPPDGTLYVIY